ncbi:hypothetical protein Tco_1083443 [Tanacetum coccineum]
MSNFYVELENSLERDESTSTRAAFVPVLRLGKRLGPSPSLPVVGVSEPSHIRTFIRAFTSRGTFTQEGSAVGNFPEKPEAEDMRRLMDPLDALARSALVIPKA